MSGFVQGLVFGGDLVLGEQFLPEIPVQPGEREPYQDIKWAEGFFPVPAPVATIDVGTLDVLSGEFIGLISTREVIQPNSMSPGSNKPQIVMIPPRYSADAVTVRLRFRVSNGQGLLEVTANGQTITAGAGSTEVIIDAGRASIVNWTLRAAGHVISDKLAIERPPIIGGGAFRLPVFPVTVLYEPPQDKQKKNRATYSHARTVGSKVAVSVSTEDSSTRPFNPPFSTAGDFQDVLGVYKDLLSYASTAGIFPSGVLKGIDQSLGVIGKALGRASASSTNGTRVTDGSEVSTVDIIGDDISTGDNFGGPGIGDVIAFLRDVELVWVAGGGEVRLSVLGYRSFALVTVTVLKQQLDSPTIGLRADDIQQLLALDPFASGGPQAVLDPSRFVHVETFEISGSVVTKSFSHQVTETDRNASATFTTQAIDMRAGFLSFIGFAVPETVSTKVTFAHSTTAESSEATRTTITVTLHADIDEFYAVEVYYDRVFGTFALRGLDAGRGLMARPFVSGSLLDADGAPLANQSIVARAGGRRYSVRTDENGKYAFHVARLADAAARSKVLIEAPGVRQALHPAPANAPLRLNLRSSIRRSAISLAVPERKPRARQTAPHSKPVATKSTRKRPRR